jgi:hypothetical protein
LQQQYKRRSGWFQSSFGSSVPRWAWKRATHGPKPLDWHTHNRRSAEAELNVWEETSIQRTPLLTTTRAAAAVVSMIVHAWTLNLRLSRGADHHHYQPQARCYSLTSSRARLIPTFASISVSTRPHAQSVLVRAVMPYSSRANSMPPTVVQSAPGPVRCSGRS